nr:MAG TPA: hypothetical protein [Caudoviricetes sp.]
MRTQLARLGSMYQYAAPVMSLIQFADTVPQPFRNIAAVGCRMVESKTARL